MPAVTPPRVPDIFAVAPSASGSADRRQRRQGSLFVDTPPSAVAPRSRTPTWHDAGSTAIRRGLPREMDESAEALRALDRIHYASKVDLLYRTFRSWLWWAERQAAARALARRVRLQATIRLGRRFFMRWANRAQESCWWVAAFARAEALASKNAIPLLHRVFVQWCASGTLSLTMRGIAATLCRRNAYHAAKGYFVFWRNHRRRKQQHQVVLSRQVENACRLGRRYFTPWQTQAIRQLLVRPLQRGNALVLQHRFFARWSQRARVSMALRCAVSQSLVELAQHYFSRWRRYHDRLAAAEDLRVSSIHQLLLPLFHEWSWQAQLRLLEYERYALRNGLPDL